jgi:hypothetical protein
VGGAIWFRVPSGSCGGGHQDGGGGGETQGTRAGHSEDVASKLQAKEEATACLAGTHCRAIPGKRLPIPVVLALNTKRRVTLLYIGFRSHVSVCNLFMPSLYTH